MRRGPGKGLARGPAEPRCRQLRAGRSAGGLNWRAAPGSLSICGFWRPSGRRFLSASGTGAAFERLEAGAAQTQAGSSESGSRGRVLLGLRSRDEQGFAGGSVGTAEHELWIREAGIAGLSRGP